MLLDIFLLYFYSDSDFIIEKEKFYTMPRGLTREERRAWAKSNINNEEKKNDL